MLYDLNLTKVFFIPKMIKIQHGAVNCKQLQNSNAAKLLATKLTQNVGEQHENIVARVQKSLFCIC